jgi:tetratricopeptide (TPR) repeat protein
MLGAAIAAIAAAARSRWWSPDPLVRAIAAAGLGTAAYFALHSGGDWIWSFPAIALPPIAWMGMAAGLGSDAPEPQREDAGEPVPRSPRLVPALALGAVACVLALASFALPWLSARETAIAASSWEDDPAAAFDRLERARQLNFLSSQPDLTAGAIGSRLKQPAVMREAFSHALERDPDNWYASLELGVVEALAGDRPAAIAHLERARELNPRDRLIRDALRGARSGHPISTERVDRTLLARVCATVGPTDDTRYCK